MKTIIAGSRDIFNCEIVFHAIKESGFSITEVVCGEARGVDSVGRRWGEENGVTVKSFPADWKSYGRAAGPIRTSKWQNMEIPLYWFRMEREREVGVC